MTATNFRERVPALTGRASLKPIKEGHKDAEQTGPGSRSTGAGLEATLEQGGPH